MNYERLPKLVIVGETPFAPNQGGTLQTMFNLFKSYPSDKIFCLANDYNTASALKAGIHFSNTVFVKTKILPHVNNRFGKYVNSWIDKLNFFWRKYTPLDQWDAIAAFNPEAVLICPNSALQLMYGLRVWKSLNVPLIVYLMDDWMKQSEKSALYKLHANISLILSKASCWMMISRELKEIVEERYAVYDKPFIIVQNPINIAAGAGILSTFKTEDAFTVVYAGSIWPMHYDALKNVSKAIYYLKKEHRINIKLIIYTFSHFWNYYSADFGEDEAEYGGELNHDQLKFKLKQADLTLVTSSFLQEWEPHSRSSVQTKITDYMAAAKPVFSYGPDYSACHRFIKEYNAGFYSSEKKIQKLGELLLSISKVNEKLEEIGFNNYDTVCREFETTVVCNKLYSFIYQNINNDK